MSIFLYLSLKEKQGRIKKLPLTFRKECQKQRIITSPSPQGGPFALITPHFRYSLQNVNKYLDLPAPHQDTPDRDRRLCRHRLRPHYSAMQPVDSRITTSVRSDAAIRTLCGVCDSLTAHAIRHRCVCAPPHSTQTAARHCGSDCQHSILSRWH